MNYFKIKFDVVKFTIDILCCMTIVVWQNVKIKLHKTVALRYFI